MKILLLTDADAFAGTERHMLALALGLRQREVDVALGCPAGSPLARAAAEVSLPVIAIEKRGAVDIKAIRRLIQLIREEGFELIHAHNGRTAWLASIARFIARRGVLVSTMHFIAPARGSRQGLSRWAGDLAHAFIRRQTRGIIAISDAVRAAAIARGDLPAAAIHRVHNGITSPTPARDRDAVRSAMGLDPSTTLFLAATRLEQEKSVPLLIEAARQLRVEGQGQFKVCVVGHGSMHDELQGMIRDKGLGDHVELLGFRQDVHDLMAAADVLVHPAAAEPFGLVLVEAMALGLPVIASNGGAAPEIVVPGQTGWLFDADDVEQLKHTMNAAIAAGREREQLGQAGYARFSACFTADRMVDQTLAFYRNMLHATDAGAVPVRRTVTP